MPINILMPALSPTMEKGNLAKWLKKEGDKVKAGDILAEIETDKATMEYEAVDEGIVAKLLVPEGATDIAVNQPIAVLAAEGEDVKAAAGASAAATSATTPPKPMAASAPASAAPPHGGIAPERIACCHRGKRPTGSRKAGTLPHSRGRGVQPIDERGRTARGASVFGSASEPCRASRGGVEGRRPFWPHIRLAPRPPACQRRRYRDRPNCWKRSAWSRHCPRRRKGESGGTGVPRRGRRSSLPDARPGAGTGTLGRQGPGAVCSDSYDVVPHDNMRRIIAQRLVAAKQTIPHYYLTLTCTIDKLLATREEANAAAPKDAEGKPSGSFRSTISSSRHWPSRSSKCRKPTSPGPKRRCCAITMPISRSRWRSRAG